MHPRELVDRLRGALGLSRHRDDELAEELRFHREMLEARHRERGLAPEEAARAARLELGGVEQATEAWRDQRSLPALDMLAQDVRYGLRTLGRSRGFTAAALATLAIGIGANAAIFTIVDAVLLRPLPFAAADRLVSLGDAGSDGTPSLMGWTTLDEWRARNRSFESIAIMGSWLPTLVSEGEAERIPAVRVSAGFFDVLGVRPALGRGFTAADDRPGAPRVLLLGDGLWRRRFGADPAVVGRAITMNDREYHIVGVLPATYEPLVEGRYYQAAEMWAPLGYDATLSQACRSCQHLRAFGRLRPGHGVAAAGAELDAIRAQQRRDHAEDYAAASVAVTPLRDAIAGPVRPALYVLFAAVGVVLLIACANVGNLLLARSLSRRRELALRAALGAGRRRIVRQLVTESLLLALGGATLGVVVASLLVRGLARLAPVSLPRIDRAAVDLRVLLFAVALAVITSVLFGLVPSLRAARMGLRTAGLGPRAAGLQSTLASDSRTNVGGYGRGRAALVVVDLALALVLLAGAGVMLRTVRSLLRVDPGFDPRGVETLQFLLVGTRYAEDSAVLAFQDELLERVGALPGVSAAALAGQVPLGGNGDSWGFHVRGRMRANPAEDPSVERYAVTPGYFGMLGIEVLRGRTFTAADGAKSEPVVVVSAATAAQVWGGADPLGSVVRVGDPNEGPWRRVVGIVGDVHHQDLSGPPTPAFYTPQSQNTDSFLVLAVKSRTSPEALARPLAAAVRALDRGVPVYALAPMSDLVAGAVAQRVFVTRLLGGFAGIAVLLAALGLYGVVSYGVAQRTREVGVRVALGARPRDVLRLVVGGGVPMVLLGLASGLAAAAATTRFLGGLVFGVSSTDPFSFAAAAALLVMVALLAHWLPVRRALAVAPVVALRLD